MASYCWVCEPRKLGSESSAAAPQYLGLWVYLTLAYLLNVVLVAGFCNSAGGGVS